MQNATEQINVLKQFEGKRIKAAESSLKNFTIEFEGGVGLSIEASGEKDAPAIMLTALAAENLPRLSEAVCSVDWTWIYGSSIKRSTGASSYVKFELDPAGPLNVGVSVWQGSPFLSFQPFRPPAK